MTSFTGSFPTCLLDFEWRIPADRQDQDKIFLFITRKTEQLWWLQRALKYQFSGPKCHPNGHSKIKLFQLFLKNTECEFTDANFSCMQLFCFVGLTLNIFVRCIHGFSIQMLGNIKVFLAPEFTRQNDGFESVISQGALLI